MPAEIEQRCAIVQLNHHLEVNDGRSLLHRDRRLQQVSRVLLKVNCDDLGGGDSNCTEALRLGRLADASTASLCKRSCRGLCSSFASYSVGRFSNIPESPFSAYQTRKEVFNTVADLGWENMMLSVRCTMLVIFLHRSVLPVPPTFFSNVSVPYHGPPSQTASRSSKALSRSPAGCNALHR